MSFSDYLNVFQLGLIMASLRRVSHELPSSVLPSGYFYLPSNFSWSGCDISYKLLGGSSIIYINLLLGLSMTPAFQIPFPFLYSLKKMFSPGIKNFACFSFFIVFFFYFSLRTANRTQVLFFSRITSLVTILN